MAGATLLLAVVAVAWFVLGPDLDQVEARWKDQAGFDPLIEYPPRKADATARDLEALVAPLGVELARSDDPVRRRPTDDVKSRLEEHYPALSEYACDLRSIEPAIPEPPPEVAALLEQARPILRQVAAVLEESGEPTWELDLEEGLRAATSHPGHYVLHSLLVLTAAESARRDLDDEAWDWLDAASRLRRGLSNDPVLDSQETTITELAEELSVVRALPLAGPRRLADWLVRLDSPPLRNRVERALRLETWRFLQSVRTGLWPKENERIGLQPGEIPRSVRVRGRYAAGQYVDAVEQAIQRLRAADLTDSTGETIVLDQIAHLPESSILPFLMHPLYFDSYFMAARTELHVELTRLVLELREVLASGKADALAALPRERPSVIPQIRWIYEVGPETVVLRASDEVPTPALCPLPLEVRLTRKGR